MFSSHCVVWNVNCLFNLFIYQARESSMVTVGFLQKLLFVRPLFLGGNRVVVLFIAFLEEKESDEKLGRMKNGLISTFLFSMRAMQRNPHLSS